MKMLETIFARAERYVPFFCGVWAGGLFGVAGYYFTYGGPWVVSMLAALATLGVGVLLEVAESRE